MEGQHGSSLNIAFSGYDLVGMLVEIEFLSGSDFRYYDVAQSVYHGVMAVGSQGKCLSVYIKKGGYRYTKI